MHPIYASAATPNNARWSTMYRPDKLPSTPHTCIACVSFLARSFHPCERGCGRGT